VIFKWGEKLFDSSFTSFNSLNISCLFVDFNSDFVLDFEHRRCDPLKRLLKSDALERILVRMLGLGFYPYDNL